MKNLFKLILSLALSTLIMSTLSGCMLAGIGLAASALSDDSDDRRAFQENNTAREKAGLPAITWEAWQNEKEKAQDQK